MDRFPMMAIRLKRRCGHQNRPVFEGFGAIQGGNRQSRYSVTRGSKLVPRNLFDYWISRAYNASLKLASLVLDYPAKPPELLQAIDQENRE